MAATCRKKAFMLEMFAYRNPDALCTRRLVTPTFTRDIDEPKIEDPVYNILSRVLAVVKEANVAEGLA
jgi:hypothetical protein